MWGDDSDAEPVLALSDVETLGSTYSRTNRRLGFEITPVQNDVKLLDRVSLWQGDITRLRVDAIVNAANRHLRGGGGVDGAIHRAAGPGLLTECKTLNGASTGEAKITKGYKLPAKHVIHAVGPIYESYERDEAAELLAETYVSALRLAVQNDCTSIAFPAISTGIYGFPIRAATKIALRTILQFLQHEDSAQIQRVILVVYSEEDYDTYDSIIPSFFPPPARVQPPPTYTSS